MAEGFLKFPKILSPRNARRKASKEGLDSSDAPIYRWVPKIKLHGTNACVRINDEGEVTCQKRSCDIDSGHFGFYEFVQGLKKKFANLADYAKPEDDVYVFGEWAGAGINKGDAINSLKDKAFFVFAVYSANEKWIVNPRMVQEIACSPADRVFTLPFYAEGSITASIFDEAPWAEAQEQAERIGKSDPYVKHVFDVEGGGEGLVYYPFATNDESLIFPAGALVKVKSERHFEEARTPKVLTETELSNREEAKRFAKDHMTPARLEKILTENFEGELQPRQIGEFIKLAVADMMSEVDKDAIQVKLVGGSAGAIAAKFAKRQAL